MKLLFASALALTLLSNVNAQLLPADATGIRMGHVHLNVTDVDAQKKFWTEQFGATPLHNEKAQLPGVRVPGMLILFYKKDPTHPTEGTVLDHFGFKVRSLPEMLKSLRAGGFVVQSEFKGNEGFPNAYVVGPDKVRIELQEDTSLPVRAASHHLHYMLADPTPLRTWYVEKMGLPATKRGTFETANAGGENLTFSKANNPANIGSKGGTLDHIGFEVKDLEAYCKKLEANGVKLDMPYRKIPSLGIAIAFLTDPTGVYIELTEGLDQY
jgi:catechol 2,3-dioxygenase-like lactoylglutathione lyase family enzyme